MLLVVRQLQGLGVVGQDGVWPWRHKRPRSPLILLLHLPARLQTNRHLESLPSYLLRK